MVYTPTSTYRLQLSHEFTLEQLKDIISYLQKLGISTLYAAPFFSARKGSTHGYDVTNPSHLNEEIGSEQQLNQIFQQLKEKKMGWLQDIVPNHMAYSPENKWLMDVLEKGSNSQWYSFFDLWNELNDGKEEEQFLTPFLGSPLDECLQKGEIKLLAEEGKCYFDYYGSKYPLSLPSYLDLLSGSRENKLQDALTSAIKLQQNYSEQLLHELERQLAEANTELIAHCADFGSDIGNMKKLLNRQFYRLCWWKETERKINYRRFFTVNDLICLNIQKPEAFNTYHKYIRKMVEEGKIQGLRVDHIDGLYDPKKYLEDLRFSMGEETFLLVEKILESSERIDPEWPIQGTTGYDFLSLLNALFVNPKSEEAFSALYKEFSGPMEEWEDLVWNNKKLILHHRMQGEFENLLKLFSKLGLNEEGLPQEEVEDALSCLLLSFPVYRTYISDFPISKIDKEILRETFQKAESRVSEEGKKALDQFERIFSAEEGSGKKEERLLFIRRLQQISGPLEAKGLEDTTFYNYNRLVSLNEVGCQPQHFGLGISRFHESMKDRQERLPLTLNCTATHDTKRGEDARQRLNALSELPEKWQRTVREWHQLNADKKKRVGETDAPDTNDEYFIYQSILAFYPADGRHDESFLKRLQQYMEKAMREGKRHTNWSSPNTAYEKGALEFIEKILGDEDFLEKFRPLAGEVSRFGILKSVGQLSIKMLAPGIPDVYQGTELPDLSMVDPDNRMAVNYKKREEWLENLLNAEQKGQEQLFHKLTEHLADGRLKLYLTHKFLLLRKENPDLFNLGAYIPVEVEGKHSDKVIAFARLHQGRGCLLLVPVFPALVSDDPSNLLDGANWRDTYLNLPPELRMNWSDGFTNKPITLNENSKISLDELLNQLPVALLKGGIA